MPRKPSRLIAPLWHTVVLLVALFAFSALNARAHRALPVHVNRTAVYVVSIVLEWLIVGFVWLGLRLRKQRVRDLLGENTVRWKPIARDVAIAVAFFVAANLLLAVLGQLLGAEPTAALRRMLPRGAVQDAIFVAVAVTAGICEEIVFRGYLQEQFGAMTGSVWSGVLMQAFVFGASHGYEGPRTMIVLGVYGCMFGALARWRRSLRPGMIAHALHDGIIGVVAGHYLPAMLH